MKKTHFKCVILGADGVGKTSLTNKFINDEFQEDEQATIGVDFFSKMYSIGNDFIHIHLWDTAGQERFKSIIPGYIRECSAAIIVYDVTKRSTFESVCRWVEEVRAERGNDATIAVVGNKIDSEDKKVSTEEGEQKAKELDTVFLETSAKTGRNVRILFSTIGQTLLSKRTTCELQDQKNNTITIEATEEKRQSGYGFCSC